MRIEHFACQMPDPVAAAEWYCEHLGFHIVRKLEQEPHTHFLADSSGVILEIYRNPAAPVPDYAATDPLVIHLAFTVVDLEAERRRLLAAGATEAAEVTTTPDGDLIDMLRDPWGFPIQLVKRARALT